MHGINTNPDVEGENTLPTSLPPHCNEDTILGSPPPRGASASLTTAAREVGKKRREGEEEKGDWAEERLIHCCALISTACDCKTMSLFVPFLAILQFVILIAIKTTQAHILLGYFVLHSSFRL